VVDVFSNMLIKGCASDMIRGLCPNFILGGVMCLQYVDDTLLSMKIRNKKTLSKLKSRK
jgi:hypothetical protein